MVLGFHWLLALISVRLKNFPLDFQIVPLLLFLVLQLGVFALRIEEIGLLEKILLLHFDCYLISRLG